jgi:hypothetical protein
MLWRDLMFSLEACVQCVRFTRSRSDAETLCCNCRVSRKGNEERENAGKLVTS